jgi:hypothetical protein
MHLHFKKERKKRWDSKKEAAKKMKKGAKKIGGYIKVKGPAKSPAPYLLTH